MIRYFRKRAFIRFAEYASGIICICLALLLVTGATIFTIGNHSNLSDISSSNIRNNMMVDLEVKEVYSMFAEKSSLTGDGAYYIIPYPGETGGKTVLMGIYIPAKYRGSMDELMYNEYVNNGKKRIVSLNISGSMRDIREFQNSEINTLYKDDIKRLIKEMNLPEDTEYIEYYFREESMTAWDYAAAFICVVALIWLILLFFDIVSGRNQIHVSRFIKVKGLTQEKLDEELKDAVCYGNIMINDRYIAFMIFFRVYIVLRSDIEMIYRSKFVDPYEETEDGKELIEDDSILVKLYNDVTYRIHLKPKNMALFMKHLKKE